MDEKYGVESIETLDFRDAVRLRIGMYLGSADMNGVYQAGQEIISNSVDEYLGGHGTEVHISIWKDKMKITDFGRGVPFGKRADGTEALEATFTTPHTGGKFSNKAYAFAAGLNGIGAKATCLSSDFFIVDSVRDGEKCHFEVENGFTKEITYSAAKKGEKTGTTVYFKPSQKVFNIEPIEIDFEVMKQKVTNMSYLTAGLSYVLTDEENNKTYRIKSEGLISLIKEKANKPVHKTPMQITVTDGDTTVEIVAQWTKGGEKGYCFVNGLEMSKGGTPITGIKSAVTSTINREANTSLSGDMARSGLVYGVSIKTPNPSFANQTKTEVNNKEFRSLAQRAFSEMLKQFMSEHPDEKKQIIDKLLKEQKAEEAAEKARNAVLESQKAITSEKSKKSTLPGKLYDCQEHGEKSILFIVEGNSAAGEAANSRDGRYHAIIPLRGKIINAMKHPPERVLTSDPTSPVYALQTAIGCGIGASYNVKNLRYGKIAILADADYDGYSIVCLNLTFFYKFCPQLIRDGKVYWAQTPLYAVEHRGKTYYAYTEQERASLPSGKEFSRIKGLAELGQQGFADTIFSDDNARMVQITMEDAAQAEFYFNTFMGTNIEARRDYLFSHLDFEEIDE